MDFTQIRVNESRDKKMWVTWITRTWYVFFNKFQLQNGHHYRLVLILFTPKSRSIRFYLKKNSSLNITCIITHFMSPISHSTLKKSWLLKRIFKLFQLLPDNIHEIANGKLHISTTDIYTGDNIIVDNFQDKQDVIDVSI